jgi:hypothetical protein
MNRECAIALREQFGIAGKVDFNTFIGDLGLSVREVDSEGFEGALVRSSLGMKGIIFVKRSTREFSRKRFTIAHEIGHYILHSEQEKLSCGSSDIEDLGGDQPDMERQADEFASELMLPSPEVRQRIGKEWPSIHVVTSISEFFDVSLTASARKYCDVASQSCAAVWIQEGKIRWFHPSPSFKYWVRVGDEIGYDSLAAQVVRGKTVSDEMEEVPAEDWISSSWLKEGSQIKEQSIAMPYYKGCLSILWANREIEDKPSEEDLLLDELEPERFDSAHRKRWPGKH